MRIEAVGKLMCGVGLGCHVSEHNHVKWDFLLIVSSHKCSKKCPTEYGCKIILRNDNDGAQMDSLDTCVMCCKRVQYCKCMWYNLSNPSALSVRVIKGNVPIFTRGDKTLWPPGTLKIVLGTRCMVWKARFANWRMQPWSQFIEEQNKKCSSFCKLMLHTWIFF